MSRAADAARSGVEGKEKDGGRVADTRVPSSEDRVERVMLLAVRWQALRKR